MLGLGLSQRGVCGLGHANNAQRGCFSPKRKMLPENIILVAGFPRGLLHSCQTQPQFCAVCVKHHLAFPSSPWWTQQSVSGA